MYQSVSKVDVCSVGYFLSMNSAGNQPGDIADIQTQFFPASHGLCYVRFFYYMYGSQNIGPLRVSQHS